jgi:hypothetical protein
MVVVLYVLAWPHVKESIKPGPPKVPPRYHGVVLGFGGEDLARVRGSEPTYRSSGDWFGEDAGSKFIASDWKISQSTTITTIWRKDYSGAVGIRCLDMELSVPSCEPLAGISIGMTAEEVRDKLGHPARDRTIYNTRTRYLGYDAQDDRDIGFFISEDGWVYGIELAISTASYPMMLR